MLETSTAELRDVDAFVDELQHVLLVEGPRSTAARDLKRFAREQPDREFERVFEAKLQEHKYFQRENVPPTPWNMPRRFVEALWDDFRFTPKRDVMSTLGWVAVVLVAIEAVKIGVLKYAMSPAPAGNVEYEREAQNFEAAAKRLEHWLAERKTSERNNSPAAAIDRAGKPIAEAFAELEREIVAIVRREIPDASPASHAAAVEFARNKLFEVVRSAVFSDSLAKELRSGVRPPKEPSHLLQVGQVDTAAKSKP